MANFHNHKLAFGAVSNKYTRAKSVDVIPIATRKKVKAKHTHHFQLPRKLGPRDIGRIKYKGTRYEEPKTNGHFLDEKIHRYARTSSFLSRKRKNPVHKKETVKQTGTPNDWKTPEYYNKEVRKMYNYIHSKQKGWGSSMQCFADKPLKPRDSRLEALKNVKLPKSKSLSQYEQPNSWEPIEFKYENNGGGFLDEKFWFEGSHVEIEDGLSHMIEALPPQQKLTLKKECCVSAPTGYQSKINFLKMLRDFVVIEVKRIDKEDKTLKRMENDENKILDDYKHFEEVYAKLLAKKKSDKGKLQREVLTMTSVDKLTTLIDDMESEKQNEQM